MAKEKSAKRAPVTKASLETTSAKTTPGLKDGAHCNVVAGTHQGKSGVVRDINTSATGYVTITVVRASGERFKTLAKNVVMGGK